MATQPITQITHHQITQLTPRSQNGGVQVAGIHATRAAQMTAKLSAQKTFAAQRTGRGVAPWSLAPGARLLRQPQDGAPETSSRIAAIAAHLPNGLREPEDARLTGGTRSLMRRVSGLNVTGVRKTPELMDRTPRDQAQVA